MSRLAGLYLRSRQPPDGWPRCSWCGRGPPARHRSRRHSEWTRSPYGGGTRRWLVAVWPSWLRRVRSEAGVGADTLGGGADLRTGRAGQDLDRDRGGSGVSVSSVRNALGGNRPGPGCHRRQEAAGKAGGADHGTGPSSRPGQAACLRSLYVYGHAQAHYGTRDAQKNPCGEAEVPRPSPPEI
jgi:hypothetical protein